MNHVLQVKRGSIVYTLRKSDPNLSTTVASVLKWEAMSRIRECNLQFRTPEEASGFARIIGLEEFEVTCTQK